MRYVDRRTRKSHDLSSISSKKKDKNDSDMIDADSENHYYNRKAILKELKEKRIMTPIKITKGKCSWR